MDTALCGTYKLNIIIQRILDHYVCRCALVVHVADLVSDLVAYLHHSERACSLVRSDFLLVGFILRFINVGDEECKETVEQGMLNSLVIDPSAVITYDFRITAQAFRAVHRLSLVSVFAPDIFCLYFRVVIDPLFSVCVSYEFSDGAFIFFDVSHSFMNIIIIYEAFSRSAHCHCFCVDTGISVLEVFRFAGIARAACTFVDHTVNISLRCRYFLINNKLIRNLRTRRDYFSVFRAEILCDFDRNYTGLLLVNIRVERKVHSASVMSGSIPHDMSLAPIFFAGRSSEMDRRALIALVPVVEALGQVDHYCRAQLLAIDGVELCRFSIEPVWIHPLKRYLFFRSDSVIDPVVQAGLQLFLRESFL